MGLTLAERADVKAAALVDVDVELARLYVEIVASDDVFAVALHWAQIDMMLDRRLTISSRKPGDPVIKDETP